MKATIQAARPFSSVTPSLLLVPFGVVLALLVGLQLSSTPQLAFLIAGGMALLTLLTLQQKLEGLFLISLLVLLVGYLAQGRGFSYFGIPPLYIGELGLGLGLFASLFAARRWRFSGIHIILVLYMLFGLARTTPKISEYQLDAIRDAALWFYASFAFLVAFFVTRQRLLAFLQIFAAILPLLIVWYLAMSTLLRLVSDALPHFPGSPLPIVSVVGPGHRGVVLAVLGAFVASGLYERFSSKRRLPMTLFWSLWLANVAIVASESRGGLLAVALPMAIVMIIRPSTTWIKAGMVGLALLIVLIIWNPQFNFGYYREFSIDQIFTNVESIYSNEEANLGGVEGTESWRLNWWKDIYDDVVHGPFVWGGWGFGPNLATEYGISQAELGLRSPHNSHLTVLARMGIIGTSLWIAINVVFVWSMIRGYLRPRLKKDRFLGETCLWFLCIWSAIMVEAFFDVYLEGPHGGIVYWCVVGAGIVIAYGDVASLPNPAVTVPSTIAQQSPVEAGTAAPLKSNQTGSKSPNLNLVAKCIHIAG